MNDVPLAGMSQRLGDLQRVAERVAECERSLSFDEIADVHAADELEDDEVQPLVFADVIHARYVLMIQSGCRLRFYMETAARLVISPLGRGEYLERYPRDRALCLERERQLPFRPRRRTPAVRSAPNDRRPEVCRARRDS